MANIPVFLPSDNNYAPFVATTMVSILENTNAHIDFYILDSGIAKENEEKIRTVEGDYSIEFLKIDIEKFFAGFQICGHLNASTYNRLLIAELKKGLKKSIYLDTDMIIELDIEELFNIELEGFPLAAAREPSNKSNIDFMKKPLDLSENSTYFSAGMLLIDNEKWKNIFPEFIVVYQQYKDKLQYADQDILNIYFENDVKILPDRYNSRYMLDVPYIMHYAGKIKPWHINPSYENKDVQLFWKYAKLTPFYDAVLSKTLDKVSQEEIIRQFRVQEIKKKVAQPLVKEKI